MRRSFNRLFAVFLLGSLQQPIHYIGHKYSSFFPMMPLLRLLNYTKAFFYKKIQSKTTKKHPSNKHFPPILAIHRSPYSPIKVFIPGRVFSVSYLTLHAIYTSTRIAPCPESYPSSLSVPPNFTKSSANASPPSPSSSKTL